LSRAEFAALLLFLVADGPKDDAGMIAVAADERLQLAQDFGRVVEVAILRHDQHAEAIAGVEKFGCHLMVRATPGAGTHFLHFLHAKLVEAIRQGDADPREVLVVANAFDLERHCVQEKAEIWIETNCSDTEVGGDLIHELLNCRWLDLVAPFNPRRRRKKNAGADTIQIGIFARP
jgi:hypothetical protein